MSGRASASVGRRLLILIVAALSIAGCTQVQNSYANATARRVFNSMESDKQTQFESFEVYKNRQSPIQLQIPLIYTAESAKELQYRWAEYDAESGQLRVSVPLGRPLAVGSRSVEGNSRDDVDMELVDSRLLHWNPITAAIPFPSTSKTERLLKDMHWVVTFIPQVNRYDDARYTAPVKLVSIELYGRSGVIFRYAVPANAEPHWPPVDFSATNAMYWR